MFLSRTKVCAAAAMLGASALMTGASAGTLTSAAVATADANAANIVQVRRGGVSIYIGPSYGYGGYGYRDYGYDDDYYYPRRSYRYYDGDRHYHKHSRRWTRERFEHPLGRR